MFQQSISKLEVDLKNYKRIKRINKGGFGTIYKVQDKLSGEFYAAKIIDCGDDQEECAQKIDREVGLLMYCKHPTIIKFIGYSKLDFLDENNITIIMELATNGSLSDILQKIQTGAGPKDYTNTTRQIILLGVSRGMKYLHDRNIIHRDLKPGNILLDDNFNPHITDFGLSKMFETGHSYSQSQTVGTLIYMAPEILRDEKYDRKSDVYSFGILMYEVITDLQPYPELMTKKMTEYEFRNRVINDNYRPFFKYQIKSSIRNLIEKCWSNNPTERPNFDEIFNSLSNLNTKDSENCILEDVDVEEAALYVEDSEVIDNTDHILNINRSLESENKRLKAEVEQKSNQIQELEQENNRLKEKILKIEKENEELKNENQQLKQNEEQKNKEIQQPIQDEDQKNKEIQHLEQSELEKNKEIQKPKSDSNPVKNTKGEPNPTFKEKESSNHQTFQKEAEPLQYNEHISQIKYEKHILISEFNRFPLKKQYQISAEAAESANGESKYFINKVSNLIRYLLKFDDLREITGVLELICLDDTLLDKADDECLIKLNFAAVNCFISNNWLQETEFVNTIKEVNHLCLEVKYPTESFDNNYQKIVDLRKSKILNKEYTIAVFISGISETDTKFNRDKNINIIKLDTSITSIKGNISCGSFEGCSRLTQITIPSSVTSIGNSAFKGCSSLTQITIPSSVTSIGYSAFCGCSSLTKVTIPSSVTSIGYSAFYGCSSLTQITFSIPSSMTSIEDSAFWGCSSLTQITIPSSVTSIGNYVFYGCSSLTQITIPSSVTSIGNSAFYECSSLTQITIPSSVTSIGNSAFSGCSSLTQITIPSSVTLIRGDAFSECSSLTQITFSIPSSVTSIGNYAFSKCSSLTQIIIPSSVTSIEDSVFNGCSSLTQITIPSSVTSIGNSAFSGCSSLTITGDIQKLLNRMFSGCSSLTQITIPSSVTSIEGCAFRGCSRLTQITFSIPSSVTSIGGGAFRGCSSLTQITIPSSVTSIGKYAFCDCSSLTQITIPSSVTSIGDSAFSGCSSLTQITIPSTFKSSISRLSLGSEANVHYI